MMANAPAPLLLHAFSTFKLGGPQARFVQLANAFGPAFRHLVVAMDGCFEAGERLDSAVDWKPLPLKIVKGGALANRNAFEQVLRQRRPDLLLTYNWGAIEWLAANHWPHFIPHVHVEDGFGPEEAQSLLPRRVWMRRWLVGLRRIPTIVASRYLEAIARQHWWVPENRLCFIANGVSIPPAQRILPSLAETEGERPVIIGTVAGLRPEKNIARLLRCFAALRKAYPVRLMIVGDGPERINLEALATSLGIAADVEFTGYLKSPHEKLATFDLFALSSDTEQLPIAMLEAMAYGVPVVSTNVGDVLRIIPPIAQELISEADDRAFENALFKALQHRDKWPVWGEAGREVVMRDYAVDRMIGIWRMVFEGNWRKAFENIQQGKHRE